MRLISRIIPNVFSRISKRACFLVIDFIILLYYNSIYFTYQVHNFICVIFTKQIIAQSPPRVPPDRLGFEPQCHPIGWNLLPLSHQALPGQVISDHIVTRLGQILSHVPWPIE